MYRKIVFALLLVLHYSMAFGAIEASTVENDQHHLGAVVQHDHNHSHETTHDHHFSFSLSTESAEQHQNNDGWHEHQHKHGINIQLNIDLPSLFALDFHSTALPPLTAYRFTLNSLSHAPAVPPPNNL